MSKKLILKLTVDMLMTMLLITVFAHQLIDNLPHEIIGITIFVLFIAHTVMNRGWYRSIFKRKYSIRRTITTIVNLLLLADMVVLAVTSVMIARDLFSFPNLSSGLGIRSIHVCSANMGLVLVSVHVGTHWNMILSAFKRLTKWSKKNVIRTVVLRIIAVAIAVCGIKFSFDMDIGEKITMQSSFGYWDFENAAIGFFLAYLSIMGLYVFITHYLLFFIQKITKHTNIVMKK